MAESIIVHFATADRAVVAQMLVASGCSARGEDAWQYPSSGTPTLLVNQYWDTESDYEPADLQTLVARLGGSPESSLTIELRRSSGDRAVDDAVTLSTNLVRCADGIVDDTYSELWTLADIQRGARKRDGEFLDCYRRAG